MVIIGHGPAQLVNIKSKTVILFNRLLGTRISKNPKNEIAKTKKTIANIIFSILLVANSFARVAPNKAEKNTPITVKIIIIQKNQ